MKILAIDPGPEQSAYVLWDGGAVLEHGPVTIWPCFFCKRSPKLKHWCRRRSEGLHGR